MQYKCGNCGKPVTNDLPDDAIIRAVITCPECFEGNLDARQVRLHGEVEDALYDLDATVEAQLTGLSGAADETYGDDLRAVRDAVALTRAASVEIGVALDRYKRSSAPTVEPGPVVTRMFK